MALSNPVTFSLPFPPSVNHYWRAKIIKGHVSMFVSAAGREYQQDVRGVIKALKLSLKLDCPVKVGVILRPPNRVRRDLDNHGGKALLDSLTKAGLWLDDSLVHELCIKWGPVIKGGETIVTVAPINDKISAQHSLLEA